MTAGLTKGINKKLDAFADSHKRSQTLATAVRDTFNQNPLFDPHHNNTNGGKFTVPKLPKKV